MRTSLTEIRDTEMFVLDELSPEDSLVFEARLLTNPNLKANVGFQRKLYVLLKIFQRRKIRAEILAIHSTVFNAEKRQSFRDRVTQIFNQ
jgi:hypothetical protein